VRTHWGFLGIEGDCFKASFKCISRTMKYLDCPSLSAASAELAGVDLGDHLLDVKLEAYSCTCSVTLRDAHHEEGWEGRGWVE